MFLLAHDPVAPTKKTRNDLERCVLHKTLTNGEAIELHLEVLLNREDPGQRWFSARTLGDIGRTKTGQTRRLLLQTLKRIVQSETETDQVRRIAALSIREISGEFDKSWEKYNPQEPSGSHREQYYLKRG
jgi:hypothetical protein